MTTLPITRMILYKHGVGYFERAARFTGDAVSLTFRVEAMNDVLKSLTAIDWGDGQVLGIEYPSPQSRDELLAGSSIHLSDQRSLQDLLVSLRGRRVRLLLDQGDALVGVLVGLDAAPEEEPLATALVSLLTDESNAVQAAPLGRVRGVELLDDTAASDLRFFLASSLTQEAHRQVTVRLTPGDHDLTLSYVAPAPTWRVSYRLVLAEAADAAQPAERRCLLLGWGIFDNRLEEDLKDVALSLVAGMPISFVYDLMTPQTPERPSVQDETRVAAGPVGFGEALDAAPMRAAMMMDEATSTLRAAPPRSKRALNAQALDRSTTVATSGTDMGELFEYVIATPVTVGRGQSAMAPIVSAHLASRKDLLYNGSKLAAHPVATLRLRNSTGLTLERGPVTVLDSSTYAGEAVLPFTAVDGEIVAPYAVELAVKVLEEASNSRELNGLRISGRYLLVEEWDVRTRVYRLSNSSAKPARVLVEHPKTAQYDLVNTPAPLEQTAEHLRFAVDVPARGQATLTVSERRLFSHREEIQRQTGPTLQAYASRGLFNASEREQINQLIVLWSRITEREQRLAELEQQRQGLYKGQEQARSNMGALGAAGKEGELRASYVDKLRTSEQQIEALAQEESKLKAEIAHLQTEINKRFTPDGP